MKLAIILTITAIFAIASADVKSESLAAHNKFRTDLGIPELTWSSSLASSAQTWANYLAKNRAFSSSKGRKNVGENIGYRNIMSTAPTTFITRWGAQKDNFLAGEDYPFCTKTGDYADVWLYTQIVWEKTTELGCAMASGTDRVYLVCHYSPAGNIRGEAVYTISTPEDSDSENGGSEPSDSDPVDTEPTDPVDTDPTDPVDTDPTGPVDTEPTDPVDTDPTDPVDTEPTDPESDDPFIADSLAAHNNERQANGVPALKWSTSLAQSAQAYAQVMASTGTTSHSTGRVNVGENLAWGSGKSVNVNFLAGLWLDEKKDFIPGKNFPNCSTTGSWSDVAHYTQLMWRKTTEVGCGIAQASSGRYNYVCHYSPQGNINGQPVY